MPLVDIGQRGYVQGQAVATLSYSPQVDRAGIVSRFYVDKPSAGDTWRIKVGGREVAAYNLLTTGNQQLLSGPASGYPKENDVFEVFPQYYGESLVYPVPQGQTITIASDGGATANVVIEYYECTPGECNSGLMNHPSGNRFVGPVIFYVAATPAVAGLVAFDTEIAPSWFPSLFSDKAIPAGYAIRILGLFLEGGGRNTYNGTADHQSVTNYVQLDLRGQLMFTRASTGGVPLVGQASAAGSANTVVGTDTTTMPAFQLCDPFDWQSPLFPIQYREGDMANWRLYLAGSLTGGADVSLMRQLALVDLRVTG